MIHFTTEQDIKSGSSGTICLKSARSYTAIKVIYLVVVYTFSKHIRSCISMFVYGTLCIVRCLTHINTEYLFCYIQRTFVLNLIRTKYKWVWGLLVEGWVVGGSKQFVGSKRNWVVSQTPSFRALIPHTYLTQILLPPFCFMRNLLRIYYNHSCFSDAECFAVGDDDADVAQNNGYWITLNLMYLNSWLLHL